MSFAEKLKNSITKPPQAQDQAPSQPTANTIADVADAKPSPPEDDVSGLRSTSMTIFDRRRLAMLPQASLQRTTAATVRPSESYYQPS